MPRANTGMNSHQSRYLFAQCCVRAGKLQEAREALTRFGEKEVRTCATD